MEPSNQLSAGTEIELCLIRLLFFPPFLHLSSDFYITFICRLPVLTSLPSFRLHLLFAFIYCCLCLLNAFLSFSLFGQKRDSINRQNKCTCNSSHTAYFLFNHLTSIVNGLFRVISQHKTQRAVSNHQYRSVNMIFINSFTLSNKHNFHFIGIYCLLTIKWTSFNISSSELQYK